MATVQQKSSGQRFMIRNVDWRTYQSLLAAIGERPVRITYDKGALELTSPSDVHERFKKLIDRMLVTLCEELNIAIRSQGSMTFSRQELDRGLEPDECYYIQHEAQLRGRDEIDLDVDPPPDLAIEIDISRSSLNRMQIYASLGVPEVWQFDGDSLRVHVLEDEGGYAEVNESLAFPMVPIAALKQHLARRNQTDEISWIRELRVWIRKTLRNT